MDPVAIQQDIQAWARGLFDDDDDVLIVIGAPDANADNLRGRFVSVGDPGAEFEPQTFMPGSERYEVTWTIDLDVGSRSGLDNPGAAYKDAMEVMRVLLNSVANDGLDLAGTNWTNLGGFRTRERFSRQSRSTVLTLTLLTQTIGWS